MRASATLPHDKSASGRFGRQSAQDKPRKPNNTYLYYFFGGVP